jgi:hypothetical protein
MSEKKLKAPRTLLFTSQNWKVTASSYEFVTEAKENQPSKTIKLVEVIKIKDKWSDQIKSMYQHKTVLTLTEEEYLELTNQK